MVSSLKDEGHTDKHKSIKNLRESYEKARVLADHINKNLGKRLRIVLNIDYNKKHKEGSFDVMFSKYELSSRFNGEYSSSLPSSNMENFAAKKSAELLNKITSPPHGGSFNSSKYSSLRGMVGHTIVQGSDDKGWKSASKK